VVRPDPDVEPEQEPEEPLEPSRTEHREWAQAYTELAEQLAKGKHTVLPDPPFDDQLRQAIVDSQRFLKNARSRQIRRVAQLMREAGPIEELREALQGRTREIKAKEERERLSEVWRARLLERGDAALSEFVAAYPSADRQRLRQLIRQAGRVPPDPRSKRAATSLIRAVRALLESEPGLV
jgi:ribosome-associated protein